MAATNPLFGRSGTFWTIVATLIVLLTATGLIWLQTSAYFKLRSESKRFPVINLTPKALESQSVNSSAGSVISYSGYTFEVPWTDLNREKSRVVGAWDILAFDSGLVVVFCPPGPNHDHLMTGIQKNLALSREGMASLFGRDALRSNYDFHAALLYRTALGLRPWSNERDTSQTSIVVMLKAVSTVGGNTGLFRADRNEWKGFQMDDPAKKPASIALELYSPSDEHVEITFRIRQGGQFHPTQADINRVLATLHTESSAAKATTQAVAARDSESTR